MHKCEFYLLILKKMFFNSYKRKFIEKSYNVIVFKIFINQSKIMKLDASLYDINSM